MKRLIWVSAVLITVLIACAGDDRVPSNVIKRDEMESILWDMMLADRYSAQVLVKDSAKLDVKMETFKLYEQVFQIHKITREDFLKSYKYYLNRPDITKSMFDSLAARGSRTRDELYKTAQ